MKLEVIGKLLQSNSEEDNLIGLEYLVKRYSTNYSLCKEQLRNLGGEKYFHMRSIPYEIPRSLFLDVWFSKTKI